MRPDNFKNKIYYHLIFETIFDRLKSMPGSWSDTQPANSDTQTLIDQVKSEVAKKENYPLAPYKAISFKSQVVAGMNFIVKVQVNTDKYIHLKIFQPLPESGQPILENIQNGQTVDDDI